MSLQKIRLRSAKKVIFSLLCILADSQWGGGLNPQTPPHLRTPLTIVAKKCNEFFEDKAVKFEMSP